MSDMTRHLDIDSPVVDDIRALMDEYDLTEAELEQAVTLATDQCDHNGPTLEEFDGTYTYEKCAKCRTVIQKW